MSEVSLRQYLLIKTLNEQSSALTSNELCSLLNISPRTLRYDIKDINAITNTMLIESGKQGYRITKGAQLSRYLKDYKVNDYLEVIKHITLLILERGTLSVYDLESECFVSVSTITSNLKEIASRMEGFHLTLQKKGDQLMIRGSEYDKRRMLSHIFFSEINTMAGSSLAYFNAYFTAFQLDDIKSIVEHTMDQFHLELNTIYVKNIVISLAIILQRSITTNEIEVIPQQQHYSKASIDYRFLTSFLQQIQERYHLSVKDAEFACMMSFITGFLRDNAEGEQCEQRVILGDEAYLAKIRVILNQTFHHFHLQVNYQSFFDSFAIHIHYLLLRSMNKNFFKNELAPSLKHSHPYLYDISVYLAFQIESMFHVQITDDEIGLIVIYLGSLIHHPQPYRRALVICICPKYNELRTLFLSQLTDHYADQMDIVQVVSTYQEIEADTSFDFIITAIKTEYILDNAIYVSPLITPRELHLIEKKLMELLKVQKHQKLKDDLLTYFDPALFYYNHPLQDGMQILAFLNQQLLDKGIIPETFLADVLKREQMSSSLFFHKFAVPHALDVISYQTKVVYYYSEQPISWFGKDIHLIMLFASAGYDEDFSNIYNLLFDILIENQLYQQLTASTSFQDFFDFIIAMA